MAAMTGNAIREALEPCPFCGGRAETWVLENPEIQGGEDGQYQGGCAVACAETPWYDTMEEVAAWWNRRARTAYDAVGSGVKALEWDRHVMPPFIAFTRTPLGTYRVERGSAGSGWWWWFSGNMGDEGHGSEDEAKAAAQADFERRVLTCLSPVAVEEADVKVVEPMAFLVHNPIVDNIVRERESLFPASRESDAREFAKLLRADCTPLYAAVLSTPSPQIGNAGAGPVRDATDAMIEAGLKVDMTNEDERGYLHNVWHAMVAAHPSGAGPVGEAVAWRVRAYPGHRWQIIETIPHNFPRDWEKEPLHVRPSNEPVEAGESAAFDEWWAGSGRKASYASVLYDQAAWVAWKERASRARPVEEPGEAVADARDEGWQPIETAPTGGKFGCFLMLAFGPPGDQTVSEGMHFQGRFYAASVFYTGGPHDTKQFAFREHEVKPTHWRHTLAAPGAARPVWEPGEVEWRDMASAPKDGTVIWLYQPHDVGGFMFAGAINADGVWINNLDLKVQDPTHWMPLPANPGSVRPVVEPGEVEEETALKDRIENAVQAMSETHDSCEARCHAIMAALGFNFGWEDAKRDAGPVGEAVAIHAYAQEYEFRFDDGGGYTPTDAERAMLEDAITGFLSTYTSPVVEPGEVERLTRERDANAKNVDLTADLFEAAERRAKAAEADLAETRGLIRDAIGLVPLAHQNWHTDARAALTGDAQEAGR